jgi:hypothetical protein
MVAGATGSSDRVFRITPDPIQTEHAVDQARAFQGAQGSVKRDLIDLHERRVGPQVGVRLRAVRRADLRENDNPSWGPAEAGLAEAVGGGGQVHSPSLSEGGLHVKALAVPHPLGLRYGMEGPRPMRVRPRSPSSPPRRPISAIGAMGQAADRAKLLLLGGILVVGCQNEEKPGTDMGSDEGGGAEGGETGSPGETGDPLPAECADAPDVTWDGWAHGFFLTWCTSCHSRNTPDRRGAPEGVDFDRESDVRGQAARIEARVLVEETMPVGGGVYPDELSLLQVYLQCGR